MDTIETEALDALRRCYGEHLRGNVIKLKPALAPLASLLVNGSGWAPDGLALTREFLLGAVETFSTSGVFLPRRGTERDDVARAVGVMWGLSGHPCGSAEARRQLNLVAGDSAINAWSGQIVRDPAVVQYVRDYRRQHPTPASQGHVIFGARKAWSHTGAGVARDWPEADEFTDIAERVRDSISGALAPETNMSGRIDLYELADRCALDRVWFPILILRDVVAPRLLEWYHRTEESEHEIWVRNNVLRYWFDDDPLTSSLPLVTRASPSGHKYGPSVAAAAQMLMWESASDGPALATAADVRELATSRLSILVRAIDRSAGIGPSIDRLVGAGLPMGLRSISKLNQMILPARVDPATRSAVADYLGEGETSLSPSWALRAATHLRKIGDTAVKKELIANYVQQRPGIYENSNTDDQHTDLALADQSVHWDTVVVGAIRLTRELAALIQTQPTRTKRGYLSHTHRSLAVIANKQGQWGVALAHICRGLDDLAQLVSWGLVDQAREQEESAQQLYLAGAGIAVRRLERALQFTHTGRADVFEATARAGLWFSGAACSGLDLLEKERLPLARHEDRQIASVAWRAQTRIIRLRVLLAVRTAIDAGLVRESDLRERGDVDVPLKPLEPSDEDITSTSIAAIAQYYRQLQHIKELTEMHTPAVVPLAAWLAFLNGGFLPVEDNPARGIVAAAELLARQDHQLSDDCIPLSVHELERWLFEQEMDALVLSWIPPQAPAWRALNRHSGQLYQDFRRLHDPHRPTDPSRD